MSRHPNTARRRFLQTGTACAAAALAPWAQANDEVPPPPQRQPLLLRNAVLHTVSGPVIAGGQMLVEKGRIVALAGPGQALPTPSAAPLVLDLGGRHVYPGFIAANTVLGLVEVNAVRATVDVAEVGTVNPNARAVVAVNPDSEVLSVTRSNGVLAALTVPQTPRGGGIAGRSAVLQLDGWTWEDMALKAEAGVHVHLPSLRQHADLLRPPLDTLAEDLRRFAQGRLREVEQAFEAARAYGQAQGQARAQQATLPRDERWEALQPALRREVPVFVHAHELPQLRWALGLAERQGLKLVIVGGADAGHLLDLLRERQVPVVVAGVNELPMRRDDDVDQRFTLPARLHAAGVRFCIARAGGATTAATNERNLPYEAAAAMAYGLPADEALKAITLYPAQILGVADRLGALAPGLLASFFVADGDPLQTTTQVQRLFVQGREVSGDNQQRRLAEKYRQKYEQLKAAGAGG
ncbi:MAG: amidohydrolase family protein [Rubrivivax sp.]|jgi:imidazolonepropionase-like amidohydrolase